jgi:hypothetical protein
LEKYQKRMEIPFGHRYRLKHRFCQLKSIIKRIREIQAWEVSSRKKLTTSIMCIMLYHHIGIKESQKRSKAIASLNN